ncbi:uncharacterized protein LOC132717690 isoform X4 [Ruditapes philippinarum]|uniref:uncharacterized protein LOC132717690 isoform X4 n=1 Tax=Ruditapes philippinarum TaxID=129788 RepID=UPI00295C30F6|nr:uncharacterized protein LOC132717690 isoform X4 [Ruditapes philippinarum]
METTFQIPDLPHDKKYHLFVCYERNSLCIVEEIVDNLEKEGVVCCYYERDFTPGRSITDNMYEAIGKSMNMLIVLSEEFENSLYCKDEIDKAFNLRVRGNYNLIPIRTEPCSIPACLQHLVYIDVEEAVDEAHTKIIDAMVKKEQQIALKEDSNGEYSAFDLEAYKPSRFSLERYRLKITEMDRARLWTKKFELWDILREKLWKISRRTHQQTGVIFFLKQHTFMETKFEFYVMRINFKPCQLYFERQLAKEDKAYLKKEMASYESPEEYTSRIFDIFLERYCEKLTEISINRRHNMNNGAKCVCLHIDNYYAEKYINRLKLGLF